MLKNPKYIVAYSIEDEIIGYIEWEVLDNNYIEITSYGVVEAYRGLGVFTLLFDKLMRR